ncbi:hypothetical protein C1646_172079 [Rhizophagus diaphanus]|nr:hypothetical protein C1646_172079 [Rhizophagus diaphanus] [Rhizophagus sp. MUCL 43196]
MSENRRRTIGRPKSSWIWEFFDSEIRDGDKWAICKLDKIGTDIPCKKEYKTCGSTKNCIDHLLNKHDLCKDGQKKIISKSLKPLPIPTRCTTKLINLNYANFSWISFLIHLNIKNSFFKT